MYIDEYNKMFLLEDSHWWYKGAHNILLNQFKQHFSNVSDLNMLDAGCGTGRISELLQDYGSIISIDISWEAIKYARMRNIARLLQGNVLFLPFNNNTFDCVVAFDLLYSIDEDCGVLGEFRRIMKDAALLILNVPSYNFLCSQHDRAISTKRRYSKRDIEKKLIDNGFVIEKITYWNTFLFPVAAFVRIIKKFIPTKKPKSDLAYIPGYLNSILAKIVYLEASLIKRLNLPFGLSLLVVAKKY